MTACGQVYHYVIMVAFLVPVSGISISQCLQGRDQDSLTITCFDVNAPYIDITKVTLETVSLLSPCNYNATKAQCCSGTSTCKYTDMDVFSELYTLCSGLAFCRKDSWRRLSSEQGCDQSAYQAYATFLTVEYECRRSTPVKTTTIPQPTAVYSNGLTVGQQAGIIIFIMLMIVLTGAGIVIYKRIKYGPPEDFRKFCSKPQVSETCSASIPGSISWTSAVSHDLIIEPTTTVTQNKRKLPTLSTDIF
ncbi:hypothetical protein BgiBS90_003513 [Biomphalaria glabrata]|uniref:Uncharacterized protein n=1 Tax=Biomphalaria glabrata TaxID=6526 RepID=A0A2C9L6F0_BIOGL|nr:hypothetical protein BgiBS90_003513 [Biomphalaria glabrata]